MHRGSGEKRKSRAVRDCLNEGAQERLTALDWPFKIRPHETCYLELLGYVGLEELFWRTSPQQKKVVSIVVPQGSKLQRTGLGCIGKEKEKRLMIYVAEEHGCSGIVLPWSYFSIFLF